MNEIYVWKFFFSEIEQQLATLQSILSPEEKARAERFYLETDRKKYALGRGMLRALVGSHLGVDSKEIGIAYGPHGKPHIPNFPSLGFNLSHSRDRLLIAIADGTQVGVDVEYIRRDVKWNEIAHRFFSPQEIEKLESFSEDQQEEAFFACWARKEALIKAKGQGFFSAGQVVEDGAAWQIYPLDAGKDYAAALAAEGAAHSILFR